LNPLQNVDISYRLPAREIGTILPKLIAGEDSAEEKERMPREHQAEKYSGFSCPECHGPLFQNEGPAPLEFRCRIGHILSLKMLVDEHTSAQERKLYEAVLALEEGADLALFTATRTDETQARQLKEEAEQVRRHAREIKRLLEEREISAID
jgi:two-component system chemotaxis response regulator CheB